MKSIRITGGSRLCGTLQISGSKNAALPILAASAAIPDVSVIHNCPCIRDVDTALEILTCLGCGVERSGHTVCIDARSRSGAEVPENLSVQMRSSVLFLGALAGTGADCAVSMPGGCVLGKRPVDLHISGLKNLGAEVTIEDSRIICSAKPLHGGTVLLPYPSVGATENLMLAALGAKTPVTVIGAAKEPEIVDLAQFLIACGARITGAGGPVIRIFPQPLHGVEYSVMPDRMEAVTYLSAAVATGGSLELTQLVPSHLRPVLQVFSAAGCRIVTGERELSLQCGTRLRSVPPILTGPYPAFPTDAQPPVMAALLQADGLTVFAETVFENRYRHVPALCALGAQIDTAGRIAAVRGVPSLHAAHMSATDLRGGAAMLVAALSARGESTVDSLFHVERGYEALPQKLRALGAQIEDAEEKNSA